MTNFKTLFYKRTKKTVAFIGFTKILQGIGVIWIADGYTNNTPFHLIEVRFFYFKFYLKFEITKKQ